MITANIQGGLGNQLFIVSTCLAYAIDNNLKLILKKIKKSNSCFKARSVYWDTVFYNIKTVTKLTHKFTIYKELEFTYKKIKSQKNIKLIGYFQSFKYFNHHFNYILNILEPKEEYILYIKNKYKDIYYHPQSVAIHVRRGDYLKLKHIYNMLDLNYYSKAITHFDNKKSLFIIFSDNIEWCKNNIKFKNIFFIENEKDYIELYLMSICKHNIIANSTFSWWGAYLNKNENKKVIAPKKYFVNNTNNKDLYPPEWILI